MRSLGLVLALVLLLSGRGLKDDPLRQLAVVGPPSVTILAGSPTIATTTTVTPTTAPPTTVTPTTATPATAPPATAKPAAAPPPPTTARIVRPSPPVTAAPVAVATASTNASDRCAAAAAAVDAGGVHTAPGFEFRCPAQALDITGIAHWGINCWQMPGMCWNSRDGASNYIEINVGMIGSSDARLRHVIAHERCHSQDLVATGETSEAAAEACAAAHGF